MADQTPPIDAPAATATTPTFNIQRIYLKDASLEIPNAPRIFLETEAPNVEVQLDVQHEAVVDAIHEVTVTVTVTTRVKDQVAFLVEAKQGGIFEIRDVPADQFEPLVGIVCPNIVYPYLRGNVADLVSRSGFPPIHLAEINFEAFYQQRKANVAANDPSRLVSGDGTPIQ